MYLSGTIYLSIYLSHSLGDRWGTTRRGNQHSPFLSFLCSPHGVSQFQTRPIPDVMFPSFSLSASPPPSPYSALEDCLGKSRSSCDMPIPLHFASFFSFFFFTVDKSSSWGPMAFRILLRTSALVMWSLYEMPRRRLKLSSSTVCIFLSISAVNVQVSQEYKQLWT